MSDKILTINEFRNGIAETKYSTNIASCSYAHAIDFYSDPKSIKLLYKPISMSQSANPNNITTLCQTIEVYDENASYDIYAAGPSGKIYACDGIASSSTWSLIHTTATAQTIVKLLQFGDKLYYQHSNLLGQYDGSTDTWTDNHKTQSSTSGYGNMVVFAGNLCVGNTRYIDTLEPDHATWNTAALTLPDGQTIRSMVEYNGYLAILTQNDNIFKPGFNVYFWDGISDYYESVIQDRSNWRGNLIVYENSLFMVSGDGIYVYNGSSFEVVQMWPYALRGTLGPLDIRLFRNKIIWSNYQGVFCWGRESSTQPYALTHFSNILGSGLSTAYGIGTILSDTFVIAIQDIFSIKGVYFFSDDVLTSSGYWESLILDCGNTNSTKLFKKIKLDMSPFPTTSESVLIYYDIDESGTYTLLTSNSINTDDEVRKWIPIMKRGKRIQIKLLLAGGATTTNTPILQSINLLYEETRKSSYS